MRSCLFHLLTVAVLVISCSAPSLAARKGGFTLTPEGGFYLFDSQENLKDAAIYGARIGYDIIGKDLSDSIGIELLLGYAEPKDKNTAVKTDAYRMRLDAIFPFTPTSRWVPFLAIGAGALRKETVTDTQTRGLVSYGAGLKYYITDWLLMRADARQNLIYTSGEFRNNFEITGGLGVVFDFAKAPEKKVETIKDADGDGVQDRDDKCPDTAKGVKVDRKGCPVDSDRDGVPDHLDKCPGTKEDAKVDPEGCPEIPDIKIPEQLEGAPAGDEKKEPRPPQEEQAAPEPAASVNPGTEQVSKQSDAPTEGLKAEQPATDTGRTGEVLGRDANVSQPVAPESAGLGSSDVSKLGKGIITEFVVGFDFNKWDVKEMYYQGLTDTARILKEKPGSVAEITGHADIIGDAAYNYKLSRRRAESVKEYFIKVLGVDTKRIEIKGAGATRPLADNTTAEGRARNRRAVTTVVVTQK